MQTYQVPIVTFHDLINMKKDQLKAVADVSLSLAECKASGVMVDIKGKSNDDVVQLATENEYKNKINDLDPILKRTSGVPFYNTSEYDFRNLLGESKLLGKNFRQYINGYSQNIRDIFEKFDFDKQLERLE
jgi:hypothetical protein